MPNGPPQRRMEAAGSWPCQPAGYGTAGNGGLTMAPDHLVFIQKYTYRSIIYIITHEWGGVCSYRKAIMSPVSKAEASHSAPLRAPHSKMIDRRLRFIDYLIQFSTRRPRTRENSPELSVTRIAPAA